MKKPNILFISPAFANGGVVCKYDKRYIDTWSDLANFTIATKKVRDKDGLHYEIIESGDLFSHEIQIIQGRYFHGRELIIPDSSRLSINPFLIRTCRKYLRVHKVDVIHTVSFPCSSHLIGYELKKEFGLPWIAHFYDPWVDNPLRNIPNSQRVKDTRLESLVAEHADSIIHSNHIIKNCWKERYGENVEDKIFIIPFGYSDEQVKAFKPFKGILPQSNKVVVSYIGTCAGDRNFQSLIKAVDMLYQKMPEIKDKIEIRLLGNLLDADRMLIDRLKLWGVITYVGRKPQSELAKYYQESDIFLVIDSPQNRNVFFPSKLVDYFYYQRPILGISPKLGVTNEFLTASRNQCYENNNIEGVAHYFKQAITDFSPLLIYDKEYYRHFIPSVIDDEYDKVLTALFRR